MNHSTSESPQPQSLKRCPKCDKEWPATTEYFQADPRVKGGLNSRCKKCVAEYKREYAEKNAEKLKAKMRAWYEANRDTALAKQSEYRAANQKKVKASKRAEYERHKEKYIERARKWAEENPERNKETRRQAWKINREKHNARKKEYRAKNIEQVRQYSRDWKRRNSDRVKASSFIYNRKNRDKIAKKREEWRERNPDRTRELARINQQQRLARKLNLPVDFTAADWQRCLDYFGGLCAACEAQATLFDSLQADHFIPLSSPDCLGTVKGNMIPLCKSCNASKHSNDAYAWALTKFGKRKAKKFIEKVEGYFASLK